MSSPAAIHGSLDELLRALTPLRDLISALTEGGEMTHFSGDEEDSERTSKFNDLIDRMNALSRLRSAEIPDRDTEVGPAIDQIAEELGRLDEGVREALQPLPLPELPDPNDYIPYGVPLGTIIMWHTSNTIPDGWLECSNANEGIVNGIYVPDLTDKLIRAPGAEAVGVTGGSNNHSHGFDVTTVSRFVEDVQAAPVTVLESAGPADGTTSTESIFPVPYYVLAFIIRVA